MKKSILFGALAFFAVSAMGIQDANAQEVKVKKAENATTVTVEKQTPSSTTVAQEPVKQKKDDCCADKKVSAEKKKGDCCAEKNVSADKKKGDCCSEKNVNCDKKKAKGEGFKVDGKKAKKIEMKARKKADKTDK